MVKELLLAHQYLRIRGLSFDLVILNEYPGGYFQTFQEELEFMVRSGYSGGLVDKKGGVFLRTQVQLSLEEVLLLEAIARVVLSGTKGSLAAQLKFDDKAKEIPYRRRVFFNYEREENYPAVIAPSTEYEFYNGLGGFVDDAKSYQIEKTKAHFRRCLGHSGHSASGKRERST